MSARSGSKAGTRPLCATDSNRCIAVSAATLAASDCLRTFGLGRRMSAGTNTCRWLTSLAAVRCASELDVRRRRSVWVGQRLGDDVQQTTARTGVERSLPTRCSNTELQIRPCEADACHSTMAGSSISIRMRSKPSQLLSKSMGNFSMVAIARSRVSPAASCGCLQRTSPHLEAKMRTHRAALRSACHPGNFAASRSIFSMFGGVLSKAAALAINAAAIGPCR